MDKDTRLSKLKEIKDLIFAFEDSENCEVEANWFSGSCFSKLDVQGICFKMKDADKFENLLGYLDVPAMLNGLLIANTNLSSYQYGFVYDDDKFHEDNLKKLNIYLLKRLSRVDDEVQSH